MNPEYRIAIDGTEADTVYTEIALNTPARKLIKTEKPRLVPGLLASAFEVLSPASR